MRMRSQANEAARDQLNRVPWSVGLDTVSDLADALMKENWTHPFFFHIKRPLEDRPFKIMNAPVVAALSALTGHELPPRAVYQLRTLDDLMPTWFSEIYDLTFWCAFGLRSHEKVRKELTIQYN